MMSILYMSDNWLSLSNGKQASPSHVQKVLQQHNYMWRPASKKPRLTEKHKKPV